MINIILNGENQQIDNSISITQLLQSLDMSNKRLAVEVNQQIVSRSHFSTQILQANDKVEIVQAIGGGSV